MGQSNLFRVPLKYMVKIRQILCRFSEILKYSLFQKTVCLSSYIFSLETTKLFEYFRTRISSWYRFLKKSEMQILQYLKLKTFEITNLIDLDRVNTETFLYLLDYQGWLKIMNLFALFTKFKTIILWVTDHLRTALINVDFWQMYRWIE